jgi:homospermidine synthase
MSEANINLIDRQITVKLYNDLIVQLNKDFSLSGIDFNLSLNCKPNKLIKDLTMLFQNTILKDYQKFNQLMYVLDIPEKRLASLKERQLDVVIDRIIRLVLERVLQKVYLKQKFGNL